MSELTGASQIASPALTERFRIHLDKIRGKALSAQCSREDLRSCLPSLWISCIRRRTRAGMHSG